MKKENLEEIIAAVALLSVDEQRTLFEGLLKNASNFDDVSKSFQECHQLLQEAREYFEKALAIVERLRLEHETKPDSGAGDYPAVTAESDPVEKTRGSMSGLDRETIIWLAEDEELCGY